MDATKTALELLPVRIRELVPPGEVSRLEEIRLRVSKAPAIIINNQEHTLPGAPVRQEEILRLLEKVTEASYYAAADALSMGYFSREGVRIGVCGEAAWNHGQAQGFRHYHSVALRIPRECKGVLNSIYPQLRNTASYGCLILSPPGGGKTTALRELIRLYSEEGKRVAVVDERGELGAVYRGEPAFDLGPHCDILTGLPKARGAMMLLRSMNPQLIAMDEITSPEDAAAMEQIAGCGVGLLASAHGASPAALKQRPVYKQLLHLGCFRYLLLIEGTGCQRRYHLEVLEP